MNTLIDDCLPQQSLCNIADALAFLQGVNPDELTERGQQGFWLCMEMVRAAVNHIEENFRLEKKQ